MFNFKLIHYKIHFIEGEARHQTSSYVLDELIEEEHYIRLIEQMALQFYAASPIFLKRKDYILQGAELIIQPCY